MKKAKKRKASDNEIMKARIISPAPYEIYRFIAEDLGLLTLKFEEKIEDFQKKGLVSLAIQTHLSLNGIRDEMGYGVNYANFEQNGESSLTSGELKYEPARVIALTADDVMPRRVSINDGGCFPGSNPQSLKHQIGLLGSLLSKDLALGKYQFRVEEDTWFGLYGIRQRDCCPRDFHTELMKICKAYTFLYPAALGEDMRWISDEQVRKVFDKWGGRREYL